MGIIFIYNHLQPIPQPSASGFSSDNKTAFCPLDLLNQQDGRKREDF